MVEILPSSLEGALRDDTKNGCEGDKVIYICVLETERARRVTQPRVRNMIREELALVKQNGG